MCGFSLALKPCLRIVASVSIAFVKFILKLWQKISHVVMLYSRPWIYNVFLHTQKCLEWDNLYTKTSKKGLYLGVICCYTQLRIKHSIVLKRVKIHWIHPYIKYRPLCNIHTMLRISFDLRQGDLRMRKLQLLLVQSVADSCYQKTIKPLRSLVLIS